MKWSWGIRDCTLWVSDYVLDARGFDLAMPFRGKYRTRLGCQRLIDKHGGLLNLVTDRAVKLGVQATDNPGRGDVGIVKAIVLRRGRLINEPTAAICLGDGRWAKYSSVGLLVETSEPLAAWAI